MMYAPFPTLTAADQAGQFVAKRIAAGSDYLKVISGTGVYGRRWTRKPSRHWSLPRTPANAELDKALVERMAEAGIVVGPTLAAIENTLGEPGGALAGTDAPNPGDRVGGKPAPGAGTPCPVRHQPGAGPGRCHG